jgi:hypothetical protein
MRKRRFPVFFSQPAKCLNMACGRGRLDFSRVAFRATTGYGRTS